jgi:hypothetical protein
MEEKENAGLEVDTATTDVNANETENNGGNENAEKRNFTQEQVNDIVRERLERANNSLYKRYGVENRDGLDGLIQKANAYQMMDENYVALEKERDGLREELTFMKNNINPDRYDDIRAYFKGKGLNFDQNNLTSELATHQEWLMQMPKQTTIETIGTNAGQVQNSELSEKEQASKLFGIKLI